MDTRKSAEAMSDRTKVRVSLQAEFIRCRIDLAREIAYDSIGWQSRDGAGGVCLGCPHRDECELSHVFPDVGLVDASVRLLQDSHGLHAKWLCPGCNSPVTEKITALDALRITLTVLGDRLCYHCRRKGLSL
jgi:hypothetical protein